MRKYTLLIFMLFAFFTIKAQTNNSDVTAKPAKMVSTFPNAEKDKQTLLQLERDLVKAQFDAKVDYVSSHIASNYKLLGPYGRTLNREQYIQDLPRTPITGITFQDTLLEARVNGNSGIVTGIYGITMSENKLAVSFTEVFVRQNDGWKLFSSHQSTMPYWSIWKPLDSDLKPVASTACTEERGLKSLTADAPAFIRFTNSTSNELTLYWINYQGERDKSADQVRKIAVGKSLDLKTFITHPFVLSDSKGECLGVYQPAMKPGLVTLKDK
jgi:hypothetical protein